MDALLVAVPTRCGRSGNCHPSSSSSTALYVPSSADITSNFTFSETDLSTALRNLNPMLGSPHLVRRNLISLHAKLVETSNFVIFILSELLNPMLDVTFTATGVQQACTET